MKKTQPAYLFTLAAMLGALLLGGCATTGGPAATANAQTHVGNVEVSSRERAADTAFAGILR